MVGEFSAERLIHELKAIAEKIRQLKAEACATFYAPSKAANTGGVTVFFICRSCFILRVIKEGEKNDLERFYRPGGEKKVVSAGE